MTPIEPGKRQDASIGWFSNQQGLSLGKLNEMWDSQAVPARQKTFVMLASQHVLKMKKNEDFLPEATDRLVQAGLTLALGPNIAKEPEAFNKMKATIQQKIMTNPEYRKKLEKLITILEKFDNQEKA